MNKKKYSKYLILLLLQLLSQNVNGFRPFFHGRRRGGRMGMPSANANLLSMPKTIKDLWVPQKLDNFNTANNETWMNVII